MCYFGKKQTKIDSFLRSANDGMSAAVPSSFELYEAGLVSGMTFVAEFHEGGRPFLAIPFDFMDKAPDSSVVCVFTGRQKAHARVLARIQSGACTAVFLHTRTVAHPSAIQTPLWIATSRRALD